MCIADSMFAPLLIVNVSLSSFVTLTCCPLISSLTAPNLQLSHSLAPLIVVNLYTVGYNLPVPSWTFFSSWALTSFSYSVRNSPNVSTPEIVIG